MGLSRRHISFLLLGLLLLMQLPLRSLHLCEEEGEYLHAEAGEVLYSYEPACELCDLVFPPVLQVTTLEAPLPGAQGIAFPSLLIFSSPALAPDQVSLRAPPLG